MSPKTVNELALKDIAHANESSIATTLALGARNRHRAFTNVDKVKRMLMSKGEKIVDQDYYNFWKALAQAGVGSIIYGRNKKPTRFKWNYNLKAVSRIAAGPQEEIGPLTPLPTPSSNSLIKRKPGRPKKVRRGRPPLNKVSITVTREEADLLRSLIKRL